MADQKVFEASEESKGKAKQLRLFAFLAWIIAIAGEIYSITKLIHDETRTALIIAIVVILILAVAGSLLWKKANRLDPASEQNKTKFFIQSQLGAIMSVLAFLPLVIFIFANKEVSGKTKGIAGAIAVVALLIASISGIDFNPPSVEKYTKEINEQTDVVKQLNNDNDQVYLAKTGTVYHLFQDCPYIKGRDGVTTTTVKGAFEQRGLSKLCSWCQKHAQEKLGGGSTGEAPAQSDAPSAPQPAEAPATQN